MHFWGGGSRARSHSVRRVVMQSIGNKRPTWRSLLVLAVGLLAPPSPARAQEQGASAGDAQRLGVPGPAPISLGQLMDPNITAASRTLECATEAPATVYVITSIDIRVRGYSTLAD